MRESDNWKVSDIINGNTRKDDELYCDYRCRLFWENHLLKQYLGGRAIWIGDERGEMRNVNRINRSNKSRNKKDAYNDRVESVRSSQGCARKMTRREQKRLMSR